MSLPLCRPRSLIGSVQAMARPRCDEAECKAVRAMASGKDGGARQTARSLADDVVKSYLEVDRLAEPLARDLLHAEKILAGEPAYAIAMAAGGAADLFFKLRLARFQERDCRQLHPREWAIETKEVAALVSDRLTRRFRNYLQAWP